MIYMRHFAPKAKAETVYHPPLPNMRIDINIKPICRTRGRLDVTPDPVRVTCSACKTRMISAGILKVKK